MGLSGLFFIGSLVCLVICAILFVAWSIKYQKETYLPSSKQKISKTTKNTGIASLVFLVICAILGMAGYYSKIESNTKKETPVETNILN